MLNTFFIYVCFKTNWARRINPGIGDFECGLVVGSQQWEKPDNVLIEPIPSDHMALESILRVKKLKMAS